jgi:hypothetical protein
VFARTQLGLLARAASYRLREGSTLDSADGDERCAAGGDGAYGVHLVCLVVERLLELLGDAVNRDIWRMTSIGDSDGIGDVVEGWLGCGDDLRRKGLHKLSKLKKPVP